MPDTELMEILNMVGLGQLRTNASINGFNMLTVTILDLKLNSLPILSVGQSQMLSLARAIVKRRTITQGSEQRPILLLDEATSSLDRQTESVIHKLIDEEFVANGHTVLMVTHRPDMVAGRMREGIDLFVYMKDGRIEKVQKA